MAIADIHEDIIKTHILTRLDGQTLAATGSTSSRLQSLCSDQKLWSDICNSTWPSITDPLITKAISTFPSGHRSFFSDSFSSPAHRLTTAASPPPPPHQTSQLLSSVDIKYKNTLIFSKVESTNTTPSNWFQTSPFRIDLLQPKELVVSEVKLPENDQNQILSDLETHMSLTWIMIDPTQNRAVNLSTIKPVSVNRNWLTNDIELTFAAVFAVDDGCVNCNIQITSGVSETGGGGELITVSGVSLTILDMYGKCLSGKDSMVILQGVAAGERRSRGGEGWRERYGEYVRGRRERVERRERRERRLDMACVVAGVALFGAFWSFAMC